MNNLSSGVQSNELTPIVLGADNKDYLNSYIAAAVFRISEGQEKVTIENLHSDPETNDFILGELYSRGFVVTLPDGSLALTRLGETAVDKKIAIVYPFGPNSNVKSYNDTLRCMTPKGRDAFFMALSSGIDIVNTLPKNILNNLVTGLLRTGIFHKLPSKTLYEVQQSVTDALDLQIQAQNLSEAVVTYYQEMEIAQGKVYGIFKTKMLHIGTLKLTKNISHEFDNMRVNITHIEVDEILNTVKLTATDIDTLDIYYFEPEEFPVSLIVTISQVI